MDKTIINEFTDRYTKNKEEYTLDAMCRFEQVLDQFWAENPLVKLITWKQGSRFMESFSISKILFSNFSDCDIEFLWENYYQNKRTQIGKNKDIWICSFGCGVLLPYIKYHDNIPDIDLQCIESMAILSTLIYSESLYDVFMDLLGDGVNVIITRNGIKTTDWDMS